MALEDFGIYLIQFGSCLLFYSLGFWRGRRAGTDLLREGMAADASMVSANLRGDALNAFPVSTHSRNADEFLGRVQGNPRLCYVHLWDVDRYVWSGYGKRAAESFLTLNDARLDAYCNTGMRA